ncbi:outer membrane beta-barrel protein [Vibrio hepatarius]|uniref:outer membrane beta-barrel protein n=1 Tax=Vibrio hepatarius TaxID=171383 RepID=UPI003735FE81
MRKHLLIAAATAVVSLPSFANSPYIAVELAGGKYNTSTSVPSDDAIIHDMDEVGSLAVKGGFIINDNFRSYGYFQFDAESEYTQSMLLESETFTLNGHQLGLGADYTYNLTSNLYLLAGARIGYYKSELELEHRLLNSTSKITSSNSGVTYGLNTGVGYMFTNKLGMEAGYRYSYFVGNEHKFGNAEFGTFKESNIAFINGIFKF